MNSPVWERYQYGATTESMDEDEFRYYQQLAAERLRNRPPQPNRGQGLNGGVQLNGGPQLNEALHVDGGVHPNGEPQLNAPNGGPFLELNEEALAPLDNEAYSQLSWDRLAAWLNRLEVPRVHGTLDTSTPTWYDFDLHRRAVELAWVVVAQLEAEERNGHLNDDSMERPRLPPLLAPLDMSIFSLRAWEAEERNAHLDDNSMERRLPPLLAPIDLSIFSLRAPPAGTSDSVPSNNSLRDPRNTALMGPPTLPMEEQDALFEPPVSSKTSEWLQRFISSRGNEYFCEVDEEYLTDRFNLTGLNTDVQYYNYALDLITDVFDIDCDDEMREQVERSARHLYGLVHARYVITTRGLAKMMEKYKKGDFGKCPRVLCQAQPLLPTGPHDTPAMSTVKLYCPRCEDLYNPKSSRHASIDGAYFGSSFHNILFQVYPSMVPPKSSKRYEPRIYGFKVHAAAALARWQEDRRQELVLRLKEAGVDTGFEAEDGEDGEEDDAEEPEEGIDDMFEGQGMAQIA